MLKLIALNYAVMLNAIVKGEILGGKTIYRDISSIDINDTGLQS